jgi:hypothetical protein
MTEDTGSGADHASGKFGLEFGLDHLAEHARIIEVGAELHGDDPPPEHPDELLTRHLSDAHGLAAIEDDQGSGVLCLSVFDMGLLCEHDEAHATEDALDLCSQAGVSMDYYQDTRRRAKLSPEQRQAESWAWDRHTADEALSPTARRYLEEIRSAPDQTKTYTRRKDFNRSVHWRRNSSSG